MDKLEELKNVIKQWNANRLDLFEISEPNKDLEFTGVMRFYFQDAGQKVATKCIRVSSTASTNDVIETLIEKFRPDIRMLTFAEYALYEIHESGEERKLDSAEKPLIVQLNWNKDDREGRFLLRRMNEKTMLPGFNDGKAVNGKAGDNTFKRILSKREKKEKKKREKEGKLKNGEEESKEKLAEKLYNELPETSFTRSISNPEAVMRRRRQQKLEKKLQQLVDEGGQEAGGTLRIFGEQLNKEVPYKTLLLSTKENSQFVVKEILEKYGLEKENANDYCLVQLIVPPNLANLDKDPDLKTIQSLSENIQEYILEDDDCPLVIEKQHNKSLGILTFHIRKKPENYAPKRKKSGGYLLDEDESYPFFIEVSPQDGKPIRKHVLTQSLTEVGCSNAPNANVRGKQNNLNDRQHLHLVGGNVQPKHCIITYIDGIVTVTPNQDPEAETFVNNLKITDSYILKHGMVVRFGKLHTFNFVDPTFERKKSNQFSPDLLSQMQNSKLNSVNNGYLAEQQQQHNENEDQLSNYSKASKKSEQQQAEAQHQLKTNCVPILPAVLELWEETEEPFLNSIITNLDVNQVQFKLAPTYTLYLAVRYRSSTHFRPTSSLEERAVRLTEFTNKFCQMINYVIHINHSDPSRLAFWLANSSELLHFIKQDQHVRAWTVDGQELLAESVQIAFKKLVTCLEVDLESSIVNVLSESEQEAATAIGKMLTVLNGAMALLRNCRVNAALTIQMFSQIFHYINMHLFNQLVGVSRNENAAININYCTESWGVLIKQRLMQIINWAKKQGLELAADCYLNPIFQAATLLQSIKSQGLDNLAQLYKTQCYKLNSLQLRYILQQFERNPNSNQQYIPQHLIEQVVEIAQQSSDKLALDYGREIRLAQESDLHLAFLLPEDGYFCDTVRGVPQGLQEFILPMIVHKLCDIDLQPTSAGHWTIFFSNSNFNNSSINSASNNSSNNEPQSKMMSPPSKPSVLPGLNSYSSDVTGEPTTPTVNSMLSPTSWAPNSAHQPPHFLIPAGPMPTRTMSTAQLGTPMHHPAANFLAQQQQHPQAIYGAGPMPQQYSSGQQLNLMQSHPAFIQAQQQQAKPEVTMIKLKKGNSGMGLSIVAARGSPNEPFGIYIKSVVPGNAADMDGRLKAGDQLLKVDGQSLIGISQEKAAELMMKTGNIVTLEVAKQAASYNGLANFLQQNNSPRAQLNKANMMNNRLPAMHSANSLMPKSQTTEHLKQHSASLVNLHPYSTYPYPQQNIQQQQQLAMMQLAAIQQQQQQQILQQPARPSSQMMNMQPPSMSAQQFAAQKRLSTSTMNDDPRNYQPTYQNISLYQQQRMNASQNAIYSPAVEQQLIQQQQLALNRPMSTIMSNRESDQMQQHFMSQTNLSQANSALRTQPQHYSSVSQLTASTTASSMPSWATLPHGYQSQQQQQQQQQLINQRNNQLAQQQLYLQRVQEEKLKNLKLEQEQQQQFSQQQPFAGNSRDYPEDELIDESSQTSSSLKKPDSWQDQLIQKTQEEQEERLQKLKLDQLQLNKFQEELQSVNEAEKNLLMIREARKQRREDPLKHYGQQQHQQQSSEDTDTSEEGGNTIQHQKLERILSRGYQGSVSSNGIVTMPPSTGNSTNDGPTAQRSLSASNVQSAAAAGSTAGQLADKAAAQSAGIPPIIQSAKSALRSSNKDAEQNGESNGNVKKVSWNEQIVNNVIHTEEDDELDEDEDGLVENSNNHCNYDDDENEYQPNGGNAVIMLENGEQQFIGGDQAGSAKDKIESSFTLQDIDEVLGSPTEADDDFSNNPNQPNNTPNVIGAQEVYRDPRERIKAEKLQRQNTQNSTWTSEVPETLSFKEKMKMFATRVE